MWLEISGCSLLGWQHFNHSSARIIWRYNTTMMTFPLLLWAPGPVAGTAHPGGDAEWVPDADCSQRDGCTVSGRTGMVTLVSATLSADLNSWSIRWKETHAPLPLHELLIFSSWLYFKGPVLHSECTGWLHLTLKPHSPCTFLCKLCCHVKRNKQPQCYLVTSEHAKLRKWWFFSNLVI